MATLSNSMISKAAFCEWKQPCASAGVSGLSAREGRPGTTAQMTAPRSGGFGCGQRTLLGDAGQRDRKDALEKRGRSGLPRGHRQRKTPSRAQPVVAGEWRCWRRSTAANLRWRACATAIFDNRYTRKATPKEEHRQTARITRKLVCCAGMFYWEKSAAPIDIN
jgi:hypothetical protein